jgi:hypothetical protein
MHMRDFVSGVPSPLATALDRRIGAREAAGARVCSHLKSTSFESVINNVGRNIKIRLCFGVCFGRADFEAGVNRSGHGEPPEGTHESEEGNGCRAGFSDGGEHVVSSYEFVLEKLR